MPDSGRKHNIHKNEGGYALLIVMLALILISMFAVTFYTTTASHHLQQQQVESTTLSVGAAEMGVQRVHYELKEKVNQLWGEYRNCLEASLNKRDIDCKNNSLSYVIEVNDNETAGLQFYNYLKHNFDNWSKHDFVELTVEGLYQPYPLLFEKELVYDQDTKEISIFYAVRGWEDNKERTLRGEAKVSLPNPIYHSGISQDQTLISVSEQINETIFNFTGSNFCPKSQGNFSGFCIWPKDNLINKWLVEDASDVSMLVPYNLCDAYFGKSNKCNNLDFNGATIYTGELDAEQSPINNLKDVKLIVNGLLDVKMLNGNGPIDTVLIVKHLNLEQKFKSSGNVTLAVLGEPYNSSWKSLELENEDKACINVNGLTKEEISQVEDEFFFGVKSKNGNNGNNGNKNNGQLYLYHKDFTPSKTVENPVYSSNYEEFLSFCDISTKYVIEADSLTVNSKVKY